MKAIIKQKEETLLKAYVTILRINYPKKNLEEIIPGEFGIINVKINTILEGTLPLELAPFEGFVVDSITLKGPIPRPEIGSLYYFEGYLEEDPHFGYQYSIKQLHKTYELKDEESKKIFLYCLLGESKADLLYKNFNDPCEILEKENSEALIKIKGIGPQTAQWIIDKYKNNIDKSGDYVRFQEYGLTPNMISKMQQVYKSTDTILYLLDNNPYAFIEVIDGIGWDRADAMALNKGYSPNGENRIKAFVKYFLKNKANEEGHSWISLQELVEAIWNIAPTLPEDILKEFLNKWSYKTDGEISLVPEEKWLYYDINSRKIGLTYYRKLEEQIGYHLLRLLNAKKVPFSAEEIQSAIEVSEKIKNFEYTPEQKSAINLCLSNNVSIVSGSAGCGKTTIMHPITILLREKNQFFAQCSLSGKAASNLSEITNQTGYTIHRLLGYSGENGSFEYNESHPLPYDVIILDELSLVGGEIFLSLIKAIKTGSRLIMLGDPNQLEAIGMANLLKDCMYSEIIPVARLTKIHRQAAKSGIITESLKISAGEQIVPSTPISEVRGELQDLRILTYSDSVLSHDKVMEQYRKFYCDWNVPSSQIAVIVPMRSKGGLSCYSLNNEIQDLVNGAEKEEIFINTKEGGYKLKINDKILITKNHYDTKDLLGNIQPVFNGNTGFVEKIEDSSKSIVVNLTQQGQIRIPKEFLRDVELGYALTCHKAQGSSSEYVIVGIDMSAYTLLSKEWVYTAMTRAKKFCSLVGQISALRTSAKTSRVTVKKTWLQEILAFFSVKGTQDYECQPLYKINMKELEESARL